ncbi:hypothetical protein L2E82_27945 [Cichorium intybus]|uniref:Uncharacterized protein n=1 Tax=Cichorium intybus TaxID=13427 RepID=A0ACB9CUF3_CICIN|nr:hypothetical protein L2E82_27945 [Cichorium intybus]
MAPHLLHGTIHATIFEVDRLHNGWDMGVCFKPTSQGKGKKFLAQVKRMVLCSPKIIGSKLYATVDLEKARAARTRIIENEPSNPRWYESFHIYCAHNVSNIIFTVKDDNPVGAILIGRAYLPVEEVINEYEVDRWLEILDEDRNPIQGRSRIHVKVKYVSVARDSHWSQGIKSPAFGGIPYTFFRQREGSSITKGGPREPWHDIHCKLEGPIAWDVLYNFEQRWTKQVGSRYLFTLPELDEFITHPAPIAPSEGRDTWNVQLFRSIDGGAVLGFPEKPEEASMAGLVTGKDNVIDRSIQDAYINAIRRAKNFIYIENQYFLGSSYGWKTTNEFKIEDIGALHLIPKELSLKIISKIKSNERFAVYIVIPMWPEGIPESGSVQAILDWQRRTIEMMYKDIASELHANKIDADPTDYLTFFCLGNREIKKSGEYEPPEKPDQDDSDYGRAQESRRFMIYVHAKMMIVDDEYIIIGSANINQRSMDGGRDTEIAIGGYQPNHIATQWPVRGAIYGFRIALWLEHLYHIDASFRHPESLECIRKVNAIAEENWNLYSSPEIVEDLPGHLLRYPLAISDTGDVTALPEFEFFPDTKAHVRDAGQDIQETMDILVEIGLDPGYEEYGFIRYNILYSGNFMRCEEWCYLPVIMPCRHLLCLQYVALNNEKCTFPGCENLYEMQSPEILLRPENPNPKWPVPKDLIELQPSYKQTIATMRTMMEKTLMPFLCLLGKAWLQLDLPMFMVAGIKFVGMYSPVQPKYSKGKTGNEELDVEKEIIKAKGAIERNPFSLLPCACRNTPVDFFLLLSGLCPTESGKGYRILLPKYARLNITYASRMSVDISFHVNIPLCFPLITS